jgi:opacity protein-like surface antigen
LSSSLLARLAAAALLIVAPASTASADWLFTGFLGSTFKGSTTHLDLEGGVGANQVIYGASVGWLSRSIIGIEAEFAYSPRFFETDNRAGTVTGSHVTTLMGNVLLTLPLSVTRESLRPYVIGGAGMLQNGYAASLDFVNEFDTQERNVFGVNMGGGAIGFVSPDVGVRFDLRYTRSLLRGTNPLTGVEGTQLRFWRATFGVTFRL